MKSFQLNRLVVFMVAVIALSKFFEAGRIIAEEQTFAHLYMPVLSLGILICSLFIMGYWVYEEEKTKNNLKKTFGLYEWLYKRRSVK